MTANQDAPSITLLPVVTADPEAESASGAAQGAAGGCCGGSCHS